MSRQIKFYGSQVGGSIVTPHSYTGSPLKLLRQDFASAFKFWLFLPFIVYPFTPFGSGPLCELYLSPANLWSMFLHVILIILQLPFILSIPLWVFLPVWTVIIGVVVFLAVNQVIWYLLNGTQMRYPSNPKYAERKPEHAHEQWIFLNGVAVGYASLLSPRISTHEPGFRKHWLQSNVDRLALTFGRPILGVHNKTYRFPLFSFSRDNLTLPETASSSMSYNASFNATSTMQPKISVTATPLSKRRSTRRT
jgi:hypothetical protein